MGYVITWEMSACSILQGLGPGTLARDSEEMKKG